MKVELKGISGPGYDAAIFENGKMIKGVMEALISIEPHRMPTVLTKRIKLDANGKPHPNPFDNTQIDTEFVLYAPVEISIEA